jgi:tRNA-2-methylthio-N6-dimethylallyladenosine synthase
LLGAQGMTAAVDGDDADLVVLNTCHIREKAADKAYSDVGRLRREDGSKPLIALAGCVAQAEGAEAKTRSAMIDIVVGPQAYHRLPEMIALAVRGARPVDTDMPAATKFNVLPARRRAGPSAFLTVQEGCDKFCTYCVVPYTRGAEISRPWPDIVTEAQALVDAGARIAAHAEVPELMPYLHLPVQSGSNRILKAMNRSHTAETYLALLEKMRVARPDIALSGDFIVGFPGESEADFQATLQLVDAVGYASAYSFKYSPRPGTPAATMEDQIPRDIMDDRLQRLQDRINAHALAFNASKVGIDTQILIERRGRRPGQMIGKSPWLQSVHVDTTASLGDIIDVAILSAGPRSLAGAVRQNVAA